MSEEGRRRFISLLVYKMYKRPTRLEPMSRRPIAPLWPFAVPPGIDGARGPDREESARRAASKSAKSVGSRGSPVVYRFAGAGPRRERADDARDPRGIRKGPSDLGRRRGERSRQRALVRPHLRREVAGDPPPRPVRKGSRRRLVETRGPLGRHRDRMGTERRPRLRPGRGDGVREGLPIPRHPSMDSREEPLEATRIDLRTPPIRPGGRTRSAVPAPEETSVR